MALFLTLICASLLGAGLYDWDRYAAGRRTLLEAVGEEHRRHRTGQSVRAGLRLPAVIVRLIQVCRPLGLAMTGAVARQGIQRDLLAASRPLGMTMEDYVGLRALLVLTGGLLGLYMESLPLACLIGVGGWLGLRQWLGGRISDRQAQTRSDLPDFLDAVAISLSAGAAVEVALQDVTHRFDGPIKADMQAVLDQIALGVPRQEAFRKMLEHNQCRELEAVVLALVHGMQLGVPLSQALQLQAKAMRNTRAQRARQLAGAAGPRITLISTLMITPSVLFLIIGLLVLNFMLNKELLGFQNLLGSF